MFLRASSLDLDLDLDLKILSVMVFSRRRRFSQKAVAWHVFFCFAFDIEPDGREEQREGSVVEGAGDEGSDAYGTEGDEVLVDPGFPKQKRQCECGQT